MQGNSASESFPQSPLTERSNTPSADKTHIRRFDQATYNQLTALDGRLLEAIDFDSRLTALRSKTGARYSIKPEAYFAKILGVTRETISDHVRKLEALGILDVTRRNPVRGRWQTNLYKIVSWVWWRLGKLLRLLRSRHHRVTITSHLSIPKKGEETRKEVPRVKFTATAGEILERWFARAPGSGLTST